MDIQKEREAFENHLKKMGKTDNETFSKNEDDSYQMDIIHFGWKIWQARAKTQAVPEGFVLVKDEPVAYMVQNKFWKGEFEVKLLSEMPEPEFDGDSYDVEIPLYMIEAQE